MLTATLITAVLLAGFGYSVASRRTRTALISRTPYNNRYNDASAAREDHLG